MVRPQSGSVDHLVIWSNLEKGIHISKSCFSIMNKSLGNETKVPTIQHPQVNSLIEILQNMFDIKF